MIARITGTLVHVGEQAVEIAVGGLTYEVLVPGFAPPLLAQRHGHELTLHTWQYLDGNLAGGSLVPRLIGFPAERDRAFFKAFTKVKNIGIRKALRAMAVPVHQLARAIEDGDERTLATLPEIGKRTASQIVAELRGQLTDFLGPADTPGAAPAPLRTLPPAEQLALEILVQWGDRRADAERWIAAAVQADPDLHNTDDIVRAAYRMKVKGEA